MEPRSLGVKTVLVNSFDRIHETNLKKQGMLGITFQNKEDYEKICEDDLIDINGLDSFAVNVPLMVTLDHKDGNKESFSIDHTIMSNRLNSSWLVPP